LVAIAPDTSFFDAGLTFEKLVEIHDDLQPRIGQQFPVTAFLRHPTVRALAAYLAGPVARPNPPAASAAPRNAGWLPSERRALRARLWQRTG
jgi:hypothetical protein